MLLGGSFGSIFLPLLLGYLMNSLGPDVLTVFLCFLGLGLVAVYCLLHMNLTREMDYASVRAMITTAQQAQSPAENSPTVSAHIAAQKLLFRILAIVHKERA